IIERAGGEGWARWGDDLLGNDEAEAAQVLVVSQTLGNDLAGGVFDGVGADKSAGVPGDGFFAQATAAGEGPAVVGGGPDVIVRADYVVGNGDEKVVCRCRDLLDGDHGKRRAWRFVEVSRGIGIAGAPIEIDVK